jgi:hypothetical protein
MGVPARFVGAPLHVFQKPQKRGMLFKAVLDGFPKSQRTLVTFVSVLLSETAGAGNGLNRKSLHRWVKTKGQTLPFGSNLDGRSQRKLKAGGRMQDINPAVPHADRQPERAGGTRGKS